MTLKPFAISETLESGEELGVALRTLREEITTYAESMGMGEFFAPQGKYWSPAGHLRHLSKSVRPVAMAMRIPKWILGLRFGRRRGALRSFIEIRQIYHAALGAGGQAGRFGPSARVSDLAAEDWRAQILEQWTQVGQALERRVASWSGQALDRYQLPHPLIGDLSVREMLFFTLYHNHHHARRIEERRTGQT